MKINIKLLIMIFVTTLCLSAITMAAGKPCQEMKLLTDLGFISESQDPDEILTRESAAVLLCKIHGSISRSLLYDNGKCPYNDVTGIEARYITLMYKEGLIKGSNSYRPEECISGKDFMTILSRMLGYDGITPETIKLFEDKDPGDTVTLDEGCRLAIAALRAKVKGNNLSLSETRAKDIHNDYDKQTARALMGESISFNTISSILNSMDEVKSYELTGKGTYEIIPLDSSYEKNLSIDTSVRTNLESELCLITMDVKTYLDGNCVDRQKADVFCEDGELFYTRLDMKYWEQDENVKKSTVKSYVVIHNHLFSLRNDFYKTSRVFETEEEIRIMGILDMQNLITEITTIDRSCKYLYDLEIVVDKKTNLIKSAHVTYTDRWIDNNKNFTKVTFRVDYVFSGYNETEVKRPDIAKR
ncbi:MAG: hypothetical protein GX633_07575 [Clostridiales bacterium]|nr:hypothetical protein [Clostridiales bacterium]